MKLNNIIMPTDFSESAKLALQFTSIIAKKANAKIHLVHIYNVPYAHSGTPDAGLTIDSAAHTKIREQLNAQMDALMAEPYMQGIKSDRHFLADMEPWEFIDRIKIDAGLIAMGTHGSKGNIWNSWMGTNTERVIRKAKIPVLSIPVGAVIDSIKRILFATDFQDDLDQIFPQIISFANLFNARIDVACIITPANYATSKYANDQYSILKAKYPDANLHGFIYNDVSVEEGIAHICADENIDLIAMLTHGRTGLLQLIKGSIAESISKNIKTPLLTFKPS